MSASGPATPTLTALGVADVVDCHHHLWRIADLPWLSGPMLPRIFGSYEAIRRDYLIDEYLADARAAGVRASVYVQANWPLDQSVEEVRWVESVARETGWPQAIVGSADLFDPQAPDVFAQQAAVSPRMRGTRLQLHWHENLQYRFAAGPDRLHDPVLRSNIGGLADLGWLFELQVFAPQMADAARLVADFPRTTFVLVHAGMLEASDDEHVTAWRSGMQRLAAQPNVVVKLTGQGTFVHRVDQDLLRLVTETVLDLFGPERAMWGSNFPIEAIWTDYGTLFDAWLRVIADLPREARQDVLGRTARRVYGL